MKKVIYNKFGNENVLEIQELPIPVIKENELLIKVRSASINPLDWKIFHGEMKLMSGSTFPKSVGIDFSGVVQSTGSAIEQHKAGDEVFGLLAVFKGGALAEYIVVTEKDIAPKPANISFEQAAVLPVIGLSALQILNNLAQIKRGQEILINGATGGVGTFLIQMAKEQGAIVTAVTSSKGVATAKNLGADTIVDYNTENILYIGKQFDVVVDLSGKLPFKSARQLMKAHATYINTLPSPQAIIGSTIRNIFSSRKYKILMLKPTREALITLTGLVKNNFQILIDKTYSMSAVKEAYKDVSVGQIMGKAVINIYAL